VNRLEFIVVTAVVLFVAFAMGWFTYWLIHRFSRIPHAAMGEFETMAAELHDAEEARDQAIAYIQSREAELTSRLMQTEAELRAAMEGLREARLEAEELRMRLERTADL